MSKYYFQKQYDTIDCGPSCLKMVAGHFGKNLSLEYLRDLCYLSREGVSMQNVSDAAEKLGFRTFLAFLDTKTLLEEAPLPAILHWNQEHFVVLYDVKKSFFTGKTILTIADPAHGIVKIDTSTFNKSWISSAQQKGAALFLEPTPDFKNIKQDNSKNSFLFLLKYLAPYKKYIFQIVIGMLAASIITIFFPLLTQILIDNGVNDRNYNIVVLVLISQLCLFFGNTVINIIRSWLLLHLNARISLNIISDFLVKLLKLPIRYFDTKAVGDLSQRISDHHRIENFLTGETISTFFSAINVVLFTTIIGFYDWRILLIFVVLSAMGFMWVLRFQKRRSELDYMRFARNKESQDKLFEMIIGMQEIKLYGSETARRWEWEKLQIRFFELNIKSLNLEQLQHTGYTFFTHLKNILISFMAAREAVNGNITLGALLSISYMIGQTNGPLEQLFSFIKSSQDAKLSMNRLNEVHMKHNEEDDESIRANAELTDESIHLRNISFQYEGPKSPFVLKDVSFTIPKGKVTAIVGTSGSGKTTLLKLLLNFYKPVNGDISIGHTPLHTVSPKIWRASCGTVMQDGYIFYDTIARNIALDGKEIDEDRMKKAVDTANLEDFIEGLPLKYTTKIGNSGIGISGGQKQRILIARAVYKDPQYLFLDEATSSLDANNELVIMNKLDNFFRDKTVLVIAHRLSTVKKADQIIVLDNGRVAEIGNHSELISRKGQYYELIKNQLELGS